MRSDYWKRYYEANKEKILVKNRLWPKEHRERAYQVKKAWYQRRRLRLRAEKGLPKQALCRRCGHEWAPRMVKPPKCPRCSVRRWELPSRRGGGDESIAP